MGLFSSTSNKKYIELLCDIGNRSVGVALVEYVFDKQTPNIIFSERLFSHSKREKNLENALAVFTKDLNTLLYNALSHSVAKGIKPNKISCFYSSPWFISETHILKVKQLEPITFSQQILSKILKESEQNFLSSKKDQMGALSRESLELTERRVTSIKLNGYNTHNPIGKKAVEVEVSVFLSAILKDTLSTVENSIKHIWQGLNISHHTLPLALFAMLRNTLNTYGSFLLVNTASDITDVSLIHNDILLDTVSFPLGYANIVERIEKECNLDSELASSAFSMYTKNEIHGDHTENFGEAVKSIKKDWTLHFENACSTLMKNTIIPPAVYITAPEKFLTFFESTIKDFGFGGYTTLDRELKVYPVHKDLFNKYITYSEVVYKDFFLETEALYTNLISLKEKKIIDNYILE
ncbi:MAG: hypothetical protein WCJ74_00310 [bacterium]